MKTLALIILLAILLISPNIHVWDNAPIGAGYSAFTIAIFPESINGLFINVTITENSFLVTKGFEG